MKKDLLITFLIAVILVAGVSLLYIPRKEDNYFFVDTPLESYNPLMSSYQGFPFVIKCNNDQIVTITGGILKDENGVLEDNKVSCNTVLYWSEFEKETVILTFQSSDTSIREQSFQLIKNEKNDYYLEKNSNVKKSKF